MRKVIVLGCVAVALALAGTYLTGRTGFESHSDSPAFQALLGEAIARLDGVPQEITAITVGEAQAEPAQPDVTMYTYPTCDRDDTNCFDYTYDPSQPTCDPGIFTCDTGVTCSRFYTCDSQYTCHGEVTCDGCWTCWFSTCDAPAATYDGSATCTYPPCVEYTFQGNYTCDGTITCEWQATCAGWPECGGNPSPTNATTWGKLKSSFAE
jgi:hypothetical protein